MKEMSKARIINKRSIKSVINERQILAQLHNRHLVNMHFAFQDKENLYLVMDYLQGGDLRFHLSEHRRFSQDITKFFVACLVQGLEYIHQHNIIHRDIKPENLVLSESGYLKITDFGIARVFRTNNSQDTSGTPGYMAPEVLNHENHSFHADFFAVGVIAFECMYGRRPYYGRSR
jgi:serum/glucocorticoid-regulated kinase 2